MQSVDFRSGFIAMIGAPNAGKSTLLNRMLGEKISITSRKPQTTRNRILGVVHRPASQMVFLDTPGIHGAKSPLNVRLVNTALSALSDADAALVIADASKPDMDSEKIVVEKLRRIKKPVILAANKIDLIKKTAVPELVNQWAAVYPFELIAPISAKHGVGIESLMDAMEALLPNGPPFFPEDAITDMPERFIVAEMIREKVFRFTGQEIPYSTAVTVEKFVESNRDNLVIIHAVIHIERDSQKGIIIGKNGDKLKQIGEESRKDIERMLGTKVFLELFVRVQKNWRQDLHALSQFGY